MKSNISKKKYIEVSFLLNNKEVISKRIYDGLSKTPTENILYAIKHLEISPIEVKSVAVECIVVSRSMVHISKKFINKLVNNQINQNIEKIIA